MPSFLDLPREIRDFIYTYLLISPTGYVTLLPSHKIQRGRSTLSITNKSQPTFLLVTNPLDVLAQCQPSKPSYTALSIVRVCRQIYHETHGEFWTSNTLYFPSFDPGSVFPWANKATLGVYPTLKAMGQTASRMIVSIRIDMPRPSVKYNSFGKVLNTLASRARQGQFRHLELVWAGDSASFDSIVVAHMYEEATKYKGYMALVKALENDNEACKYERVIRFPPMGMLPCLFEDFAKIRDSMDAVAEELHGAFGGKLFWGENLAWEKGERKLSVVEEYKRSEEMRSTEMRQSFGTSIAI